MGRLFGDQRQQQQFQIARGEDPRAASAAFTAGPFFKTVAVFACVTQVRRTVVGRVFIFTHVFHLWLHVRYTLRYI